MRTWIEVSSTTLAEPYLAAHASTTRIINESLIKTSNEIRPCTMLIDALSKVEHNDIDDIGYRSLLLALSFTTGEDTLKITPPGFYSPLAFKEDITPDIEACKRKLLSTGIKTYFERQFEEVMRNSVQQGVAHGRITGASSALGESRGQLLKTYVHYLNRCSRLDACAVSIYEDPLASNPGEQQTVYLWPLVFFSLRIGALDVAGDELTKCTSQGIKDVDAATARVIWSLQKAMQPKSEMTVSIIIITEYLLPHDKIILCR
jgi:hypothetical protein